MEEILKDMIEGHSYCTDYYEISYIKEIDEVYFQNKSCGYTMTKDEFLEIKDIENYQITL